MSGICVKAQMPFPINDFEKFSDDFLRDFHAANSKDEAVQLARIFLDDVLKHPQLQQQVMLRRAQQGNESASCTSTTLPKLEIQFSGGQLNDFKVLTPIKEKTWDLGIVQYVPKDVTNIYDPPEEHQFGK